MIKNHINLIIIETETHILKPVVENNKNRKQKIRKTTLLSWFSKYQLALVMGLYKKKQKKQTTSVHVIDVELHMQQLSLQIMILTDSPNVCLSFDKLISYPYVKTVSEVSRFLLDDGSSTDTMNMFLYLASRISTSDANTCLSFRIYKQI